MTTIRKLGRREFLKLTGIAGAGLLIGFNLSGCGSEPEPSSVPTTELATPTEEPPPPESPIGLNAFISISPDDVVTLVCHHSEMGQGVRTALPMIIAEELCADWSRVRVVQAIADENTYGSQNTGGSQSVVSNYDRLREIGAIVRAMLTEAAARRWGVDVSVCYAENGAVINRGSGELLRFGDLAAAAAEVPPPSPDDISLKDPADFTIIGTPTGHVDELELVTGTSTFGLDVRVPDMLYATRNGRIEQTGLRDYPILRMDQMPEVRVSIIDSSRHPQGVGEPPIPSVAPAVANAVFDATGVRVRHLPIRPADLV